MARPREESTPGPLDARDDPAEFFSLLEDALGPYSESARALQEVLWKTTRDIRELPEQDLVDRWYDTSVVQVQTARTIADKARDLAEILKKTEPQFWETRERGYLEFNWTPEARAAASSLADLTSWPPAVYAHKVLMDLAAAAERWHDLAQRDSRKRGRPSGRRRIHLASWVAIHMLHAEVPITKSKEGTFARVLSLVEYYSGMPEADVQRSVRYAFDNDGVKELLQNTAARFPRPKRRRVTAAKLPSTKRRIT